MSETEQQVISKQRVAQHGEVLTARREVDAMLDLVKQETERLDSRFLEPACGTGNFLIAILERKLAVIERKLTQQEKQLKKAEKRPGWKSLFYDPNSLVAVGSIYGIDILQDNIEAAKERLIEFYIENYKRVVEVEPEPNLLASVRFILDKNILLGDAIHTHESVTVPGVPGLDEIIFTEWSRIGDEFKRREFRFDAINLDGQEATSKNQVQRNLFGEVDERYSQMSLFDEDPVEPTADILTTDTGKEIYKPRPVKDYPLVHYLHIANGK